MYVHRLRGGGIFFEFDRDHLNAWVNGASAINQRIGVLNAYYMRPRFGSPESG